MDRTILFDGKEIVLIDAGLSAGQGPVCVTFSALSLTKWADRPHVGFGEKFLRGKGIPSLHFVAKRNHWWQVSDMQDCLALASQVLQPGTRRFGYGSSMGAYGALNYSTHLQLDAVLAYAPQFSVDPTKVPWDKRWRSDWAGFEIQSDDMDIRADCTCFVVFDPDGPDGKHVRLIEGKKRLVPCKLPGAGHLVAQKIQEIGLLEPFFLSAFKSDIDRFTALGDHARLAFNSPKAPVGG